MTYRNLSEELFTVQRRSPPGGPGSARHEGRWRKQRLCALKRRRCDRAATPVSARVFRHCDLGE